MAEALSREEGKLELRALFRQLDTDGNGRLSSEEWARGMGKQGAAMAKYFGGSTYEDLARAFSRMVRVRVGPEPSFSPSPQP